MAAFKLAALLLLGLVALATASPRTKDIILADEGALSPEVLDAQVTDKVEHADKKDDLPVELKDVEQGVVSEEENDDELLVDLDNEEPFSARGLRCKGSKCRRKCNKKGKNGACVGPVCVCWR